MRLMKLFATSAVVIGMTTTPVLAAQGSASSLSIAKRASSKSTKSNELAPAVIIGVLATAAIIGGAVALANNDDDPDSP